jgi:rare lipoprotein A (peptidoglycan hydrolase)
VKVNDTGSNRKRDLDVSRYVAEKLGFKKAGLAFLEMEIVFTPEPYQGKVRNKKGNALS